MLLDRINLELGRRRPRNKNLSQEENQYNQLYSFRFIQIFNVEQQRISQHRFLFSSEMFFPLIFEDNTKGVD